MDIVLRLETPADYAETEKVVREAFWNVYAPGCTEHYLVHVMRSSENFVREVLTLGPIAVLPAYQKKGLRRCLIDHARKEAMRQGYAQRLSCAGILSTTRKWDLSLRKILGFERLTTSTLLLHRSVRCRKRDRSPMPVATAMMPSTTSARRRRLNLISNFRRKIASRTRRHKNDCWKLLQCSDRLTAQNAREPA